MLGAMLVGAWLLIQQQCCSVYGDLGSRFRNAALVDPLMRRSPLEKNFMRFGRSSPSTFSRDARLKENFMRFGRTSLDPLLDFDDFPSDKTSDPNVRQSDESVDSDAEKLNEGLKDGGLSRMRRAKDNFMRFGREHKETDKTEDEKTKRQGNFMRFGRNKDDSKEASDLVSVTSAAQDLLEEPDITRAIRAKDNFMRFGRDKERVVRNEKGKQDSFIRFGKSENPEQEEYDNCDETPEKRQAGIRDSSFLRFGRGNDKFMRFGKKSEDGIANSPLEKDKAVLIRIARDQGNIVRTARQRQQDNGFIRFGRSERQKRDTHKHKDALHHLSANAPNSHRNLSPGACKSFLLNENTEPVTDTDCKDGSCKPLYLPWPFYYQPSLYSVLPNVLAAPQVSKLSSPQLVHKPKRSRGNLQNFIRLG